MKSGGGQSAPRASVIPSAREATTALITWSRTIVALTLVTSSLLVGALALAEDDEPVADPVRAAADAAALSPGHLIRITRDYNNDGLDDVAIGLEESCGNKTCSLELFLQTHDHRYERGGTLGSLPFGNRLVPTDTGRSRWETCTAIGETVSYSAVLVSMDGFSELTGRTLTESETDTVCRWAAEYTRERCALNELRTTGRCSWERRPWR